MGVYIGVVEKKSGNFFNFKPVAEVNEGEIHVLDPANLEKLLPESERRNINFSFSRNERDEVEKRFGEKSLIVFDFETGDLEANYKSNGERNQTGYKVQVIDLMNSQKISFIHSVDVYFVVQEEDIISHFLNDAIVSIKSSCVHIGDLVFVEWGDYYVGPYAVGYRSLDSVFYIKPQIKEKKYVLCGYHKDNMLIKELSFDIRVVMPEKDAPKEQIDVVSDTILLESFHNSLQKEEISKNKIDFDSIPTLLQRYEESLLTGSEMESDIIHGRLERLKDILISEENAKNTVCDLLVNSKDMSNVEDWLQTFFQNNPELIKKFKEIQPVHEQIEQLDQDYNNLKQDYSRLMDEYAQKQTEIDKIDKELANKQDDFKEYQANKEDIYRMSEEKDRLRKEIEDSENQIKPLREELKIANSIEEFKEKKDELQRNFDELQANNKYVFKEFDSLKKSFDKWLSESGEKMIEFAFNGFMASKMLHAAAEFENREETEWHEQFVEKINKLDTVDKTPGELIDYLCHTIQIVRPTYDRNTIVNIAICITQGFLTVFSGEPGCGKTSICNIFGEVLGLNKIVDGASRDKNFPDTVKRYIPVSVEKGWTSKRDFVGYYNPLSKTFDKSNRRMYDALRLLDVEKRKGLANFPFIILLDEANLSPMEYYWSDFMFICDDLGEQSRVNLGEKHVFGIPETLHFVATINNDDTTATLSPRLIDRAWVISLPQKYDTSSTEKIPPSAIEIISWRSLCDAFVPQSDKCVLSDEIKCIYDQLTVKLSEKRFSVSPRLNRAIKRYWFVAEKYFDENETKTKPAVVALDYAIAQRVLPKIMGNGEDFEIWLNDFRDICNNKELNLSAKILQDIIVRGNQQMKYYQFF